MTTVVTIRILRNNEGVYLSEVETPDCSVRCLKVSLSLLEAIDSAKEQIVLLYDSIQKV